MRNPIFVDSGYVIALVNHRDQHHSQAIELVRAYNRRLLVVTDAVVLEIGNALVHRFRRQAVEVIERFLASDDVQIVHLTSDLLERAFAVYRSHQDKAWSLVDCVSFEVMREMGINRAPTFDHHFAQAGFVPLLRVGGTGDC